METNNNLTTQPVPKLILRIGIPASVGYFFNTMYNVVDTYFAGMISTQVLAALSLSQSVFFIIIAVGMGISTGTTALIANKIGAGDREDAKMFSMQGITFGVLISFVLTYLGITVSPTLFTLLGASGDYLIISLKYMDTIFYGAFFFMLVFMFNSILNALGDTKSFRNFLVTGFLLNIILDPWFIYGGMGLPPLGMVGVALATVLIQFIGCLYMGYKVRKTGLISFKALRDFLPKAGYFKEIARQGFPASINMFTIGSGIFVITYFISAFGKEAVAAYGAAMRVEQIVLVPTIGLNIATLSIVAQNYGAGFIHRMRETLNATLLYGGYVMVVGTLCVFIFSGPLMTVFTDDANVIKIGAVYLKIDSLVFYAYVILFIHVAALQGIKRPMYAVYIGIFRQILAPVALFYLLTRIFDFGLMGIWWGIFSITWFSALFTIFYARKILKSVKPSTTQVDFDY